MEFVKIRKNSRVSSTVPVFNFVPTDEENLSRNKYDEFNRNRKFSNQVSNASSSEGSESMPSIGYPFDLKKAEDQQMLGKVAPQWISKKNITNCALCESKFTLVHRSHHCNACGQIVCSGLLRCVSFGIFGWSRTPNLRNLQSDIRNKEINH